MVFFWNPLPSQISKMVSIIVDSYLLLTPAVHFSRVAPLSRAALGDLLRGFDFTDEIEYLNEAISVVRDNLNSLGPLDFRLPSFRRLIQSLSIRLFRLYRKEDLDEIM